VTDRRQKVLFHTLRHTFASWLVQQGEDLYMVQKLMGHASLVMTERYSHLAPDTLRTAVKNFEKNINTKRAENKKVIELKKKEKD
jgi:site-specific recombinase XerD